jgi:hypothetical protein
LIVLMQPIHINDELSCGGRIFRGHESSQSPAQRGTEKQKLVMPCQ